MKNSPVNPGKVSRVVAHVTSWPAKFSARVRKKLAGFDHKIAMFRQRRWP